MLAPTRPSATRAGVSSRRTSSGRDGGAGVFMSALLGGDRGLAQPDRIVRCVLLTARRSTCEHDQMVRDHGRTDQALDIALPQSPQCEFPERLPVVAEHP